MTLKCWGAAGVMALCAFSGASAQGAAPTVKPNRAITYVEKREGGRSETRTIRESGNGFTGIDINSRLAITVNRDTLIGSIRPAADTSSAVKQVVARIDTLRAGMQQIGEVVKLAGIAVKAYGNDRADFVDTRTRMAALGIRVLDGLQSAVEQRFQQEGRSPAEAQAYLDATTSTTFGSFGFDWSTVTRFYAEEIHQLETAVATTKGAGLGLEISAFHVTGSGGVEPVALPRYNQVQQCAVNRFEKVQFAVPEQELLLFAQYDSLRKEIGTSRNAAQAVVTALRKEVELKAPALQSAAVAADSAVRSARAQLKAAAAWADEERLTTWLTTVRDDLRQTERGRRVEAQFNAVRNTVLHVGQELRTLEFIAGVRDRIDSSNPEVALNLVLSVVDAVRSDDPAPLLAAFDGPRWRARGDSLKALVDSVRALEPVIRNRLTADDGPVAAFSSAVSSTRAAGAAVETAGRLGVQLLQNSFVSRHAREVAEFPVPAEQRRVELLQQLDTEIDLQRFCTTRRENDRITVRYVVYDGDKPIDEWRDEFMIKTYGMTGRAMASLTFTKRDQSDTWQPLPALNWILRYRNYPGNNTAGIKRPLYSYLGLGFSTMSLDFDATKDVEIGLTLTASLLDDWILGGYGWNLQVSDRRTFFFFALRLFNAPGVLGKF